MIRSAILIVAALVAKVCSVINPGKGFDKPVMMQGDSYVYYMNQVFDVSQAVGIPNFRTSAGQIRTYQTVLNSKQLTAGYAQVEAMEFINNQTFALVLDNSHAIIQTVDTEGLNFTTTVEFSYFRFGPNIRCDDIEVYYPTLRAYILCWDIQVSPNPPGMIYLFQVDMTNTSNYQIINIAQDDGFSASHRLRLGIWDIPQGGDNETYLIFYDQGLSGGQQFGNKWFRYCDNIKSGFVKYQGVVNITAGYPQARTLYDIFYFNNQLLLTSSTFLDNQISMTACTFYEFNNSVFCDVNTRKVSGVSLGYIGLTNNGEYISFDIANNIFKTCGVGQYFGQPDWISTNCDVITSMPKMNDCFVRIVEDNYHAKLIVWAYPDGTLAGISVYSRELGRSFMENGTVAVLINRQVYQATPQNLTVRRMVYDNLLIKASDLPGPGEAQVFVTANDDTFSPKTLNLQITLLETALDGVEFEENHRLPEIDTYDMNTVYFPLTEDDYFGNNLQFSATFDPSVSGFVSSTSYTTFPINIVYVFKTTGIPEFDEVTFTNNHAIAKDKQSRIFIFRCGTDELDVVRCDEEYSFQATSNDKLQSYSREVMSYVFFGLVSSQQSTIFIYDPNAVDLYRWTNSGPADDTHAVAVNNRVYLFMSYQTSNTVYVRSWSAVNPTNFNVETSLTPGTSNMPQFCPTEIFDTWTGQTGYLEILSLCYNQLLTDQRVFRYNLTTMAMVGTHPISNSIAFPTICALGDSYIIGSVQNNILEGRSQYADESRFYFYLHQFANYSKYLGMNCVQDSGMVTVYYEDQYHRLGFFSLWGDSMKQANKRVHSVRTGMNAGAVNLQSFSVQGVVVHVLYDGDGAMNYWLTLSKVPLLKLDVNHISQSPISGNMYVSMTNGGKTGASIQNALTIRSMDNTLTVVEKKNNLQSIPSNISLEDYYSISGNVFNATLSDSRTDKSKPVYLQQRVSKIAQYVPSELNQVLFQHIEAHGQYTIALHMDRSFASFFTIFMNNFDYQGVYQPRYGVKAFDFGLATNNRVVIAYSSAPVSGDRLFFALMGGKYLIYETSTSGTYSKLRFAEIDTSDNYLLFGLDDSTSRVDVFLVNISKTTLYASKIYSFSGAMDIDVTDAGSKITLFYTTPEAIVVSFKSWNKANPNQGPVNQDNINIQGNHSFWLQTVSCVNDGANSSTCIVNSIGDQMFEFTVVSGQNNPTVNIIYKFGNYDGKYLYIDESYIAMRAVTNRVPREYAFLIWQRVSKGGNGYLYSGVSIDGAARPGTNINSGFTPFTLIKDLNGDSVLFAGTHNELEPIQFMKVDTFRLIASDIPQSDYNQLSFFLRGYLGTHLQSPTVGSMLEKTSTKAWWPWVLIGAGGLIVLVAGVYFLCRKRAEWNQEAGTYFEPVKEGASGQFQSLSAGNNPSRDTLRDQKPAEGTSEEGGLKSDP